MDEEKGIKGLVTIGVPTYNRAGTYLRAALDSILAQTYKNFEVMVSDNASADDTEEVCREYAKRDPRINYIRQKRNIGGILNRSFVRARARGEYFVELCDDDLLAPTFLEKCIARLEAHPEAIAAGTNFVEFDGKGRKVAHRPELFYPSEKDLYRRLKQYTLLYEADEKVMFVYCAVWRRRAVVDDLFVEYPIFWWDFQDMNFVFRGLSKGTFEFIDEVLFFKRLSDSALDAPRRKSFPRRMFDTLVYSRLRRLVAPFFYRRMGDIIKIKELSAIQRTKLILWTLFVMSRLFWRRKI